MPKTKDTRVLEIPLISLPVCLKTSFQLESGKSLGWAWLLVKKRMQNLCCLHQIIPYINASIFLSYTSAHNVWHLILLSHVAIWGFACLQFHSADSPHKGGYPIHFIKGFKCSLNHVKKKNHVVIMNSVFAPLQVIKVT